MADADNASNGEQEEETSPARDTERNDPIGPDANFHHEQMLMEVRSMFRYGSSLNKKEVWDAVRPIQSKDDWRQLTGDELFKVHQALAQAVWPATTVGIRLVEPRNEPNQSWWRKIWISLGPVPLIRWLIIAAVMSLGVSAFLFICDPDVLMESISHENVEIKYAVPFAIAAAGMGSSFNALFTAFRYINSRRYDPANNASYIGRFVLGLVSGLILVFVLFGADLDLAFGTALIAIVGGFSSDLVFRILNRFTKLVDSIIPGGDGTNTGTPTA